MIEEQDISQAAVCSAYAAKVHGLEVLVDEINDDEDKFHTFYRGYEPENIFEKCFQDQHPF